MSCFDAYVGNGGTYNNVSEALNAGKSNICVLSDVVEVQSWIITSGEIQVTITPNATIFYSGVGPLIADNGSLNPFYLSVSGGTLKLNTQYITKTSFILDSYVKFQYVTLILDSIESFFSSNILTVNECNIKCNALYLTDSNNSRIVFTNNTVFGNVMLSSEGALNIDANINQNIFNGSLTLFANEKDIPLDPSSLSIYPKIYRINNNVVGILGLNSYNKEGNSMFCGFQINSNRIDSLLATSQSDLVIAYSEINSNTVSNVDLSNNLTNNWCSIFMSDMNSNTFNSDFHLGNILFSNFLNNSFRNLIIGNNDEVNGSFNISNFKDNIANTLTINFGTNYVTSIEDNYFMTGSLNVLGSMIGCSISDNRVYEDMIFHELMNLNLISGNLANNIVYKKDVIGDIIERHDETSIHFQGNVQEATIQNNSNFILTCDGKLCNSRIVNNNNLSMVFNGSIKKSIISGNINKVERHVTFNRKVCYSQIINNVSLNMTFYGKTKKSVIRDNIV